MRHRIQTEGHSRCLRAVHVWWWTHFPPVSWVGAFTFAVSGDGLFINDNRDTLYPVYFRNHTSAGPGNWSLVSSNIECSEENEVCVPTVPIPASLWLLLGALGATWTAQRLLQGQKRRTAASVRL